MDSELDENGCAPKDLYEPKIFDVPKILFDIGPLFIILCKDNTTWIEQMSKAMKKDLLTPVQMAALLQRNPYDFDLSDVIMAFRGYFNINRCNGTQKETFAKQVMNHRDRIQKGIY